MKISQTTIEQLAWYVVLIVLIGEIVLGIFLWQTDNSIKNQQIQFHKDNTSSQQTIINNQDRLDSDLRNSVKCLFSLNPTTANTESAQACFNVVVNK